MFVINKVMRSEKMLYTDGEDFMCKTVNKGLHINYAEKYVESCVQVCNLFTSYPQAKIDINTGVI